MNVLLCAVMIGTRCVLWHPAGTKLSEEFQSPWAEPAAIRGVGTAYGNFHYGTVEATCRNQKIAIKQAMLLGGKSEVHWSCRKDELDLVSAANLCAMLDPLGLSYAKKMGRCK